MSTGASRGGQLASLVFGVASFLGQRWARWGRLAALALNFLPLIRTPEFAIGAIMLERPGLAQLAARQVDEPGEDEARQQLIRGGRGRPSAQLLQAVHSPNLPVPRRQPTSEPLAQTAALYLATRGTLEFEDARAQYPHRFAILDAQYEQ